MAVRTVAAKMAVQAGARAYLSGPAPVLDGLGLPPLDRANRLTGAFDHLHVFVTSGAELDAALPALRAHLAPAGRLWVSWPKGGQLGTDLTLPEVIRISYDHGLVESTCLSVDATWSALKLTHPKPGKVYRNSFGRLAGT